MGVVAEIGASGSLNHHGRWCWVFFERMLLKRRRIVFQTGSGFQKGSGLFLNRRQFKQPWVAVLVVEQGGGYQIAMGGGVRHHLGVGACSKNGEGGGGDQW